MDDNVNVNSIAHYIDRVCKDAAEATGKVNDVKWQFCIIENYCVFSMKSKYITIRRRILYRLAKNFNKRFPRLEFQFVPQNITDQRMTFFDPVTYGDCNQFDSYSLDDGIDFNHSFTEWNLFGKKVTLTTFSHDDLISPDCGKPGTTVVNKHYQNFIDFTIHEGQAYAIYNHNWKRFQEDYEKIYGKKMYHIDSTYTNYESDLESFKKII